MAGFLQRLRDLIERGRLEIEQVRIADLVGWLLALSRERSDTALADLCGGLEAAARLTLLKARRINGSWQASEEEAEPWLGPPPELPLRRSWLGARIARGPLSFVAGGRTYETIAPALAPIAPEQLRAAMIAVLQRRRGPATVRDEPRPPRISTEMCSALILERLHEDGEVRLEGVAGQSRDAHVAAFLTCLLLARQGRISLVQDEPFGDILIRPSAEALDATA